MLTLREMLETLQRFAEENPELLGRELVVPDGENDFRSTVGTPTRPVFDFDLSEHDGVLLLSL